MPAANVPNFADPRSEEVAPVMSSVGECSDSGTASRSNGMVFWAKLKRPRLYITEHSVSIVSCFQHVGHVRHEFDRLDKQHRI